MRKKGQMAIAIIIVLLVLGILFVSAIVAPFGLLFTTQTYQASEIMLNMSEDVAEDIIDPTIKQYVLDNVDQAKASTQDNIDVFASIYQYGWVLVLFIIGLVGFLWTRRAVETGGLV